MTWGTVTPSPGPTPSHPKWNRIIIRAKIRARPSDRDLPDQEWCTDDQPSVGYHRRSVSRRYAWPLTPDRPHPGRYRPLPGYHRWCCIRCQEKRWYRRVSGGVGENDVVFGKDIDVGCGEGGRRQGDDEEDSWWRHLGVLSWPRNVPLSACDIIQIMHIVEVVSKNYSPRGNCIKIWNTRGWKPSVFWIFIELPRVDNFY